MLYVTWCHHPTVTAIPTGLSTVKICILQMANFQLHVNFHFKKIGIYKEKICVICCGGSDQYFCNSSLLMHLLCIQLPLKPWATQALPHWAHGKSAKKGFALTLVKNGGSLPGSFLL